MDMPQLTDGHKKLETIAGTWTGDEHMQPSQWVPEPMTAQGKSVCKLILNGFAVSMDYVQSCGGQEMFSGHGVYTYNGKDDSYLLHWFDSMGAGCEVFSGGFDGDTLVIVYDGEQTSVRLARVNAPERNEPGGAEATEALRGLVDGRTVRIEFTAGHKRDNFGRLLCSVSLLSG